MIQEDVSIAKRAYYMQGHLSIMILRESLNHIEDHAKFDCYLLNSYYMNEAI